MIYSSKYLKFHHKYVDNTSPNKNKVNKIETGIIEDNEKCK